MTRARQPDGPAVGVGGGQREAPERQPEPAGQLGADPGRVLGRQHGGGPARSSSAAVTAATVGAGEWPAMAAVSPRHRST